MLSTNDVPDLMGSTVQDSTGDKVGKVGQVYLDDKSGSPEWVTVSTGLFGSKESFVPVAQARFADGILTVPVAKDSVKDAPQLDQDGHLSAEQETELYRHYGLQYDESDQSQITSMDRDVPVGDDAGLNRDAEAGVVGRDTSGPTTDQAMTRSEERLEVGTERVQAGQARLRKYIVTETQTVQVPVSREEVRIEREPITDANRDQAMAGGELTEEEHELTLTEERVVVNKETVPVERVKLGTETVQGTETVSEEVRSEQIDIDGNVDGNIDGNVDSDRLDATDGEPRR